ncbi:MAG: hypothetical protein A3J38_04165 [Gammaproteobacteria bacterium RIFCSPHIGHO2_12_FULL_45_9]|nr:MAG: hypothetical protein A3J38_04165 [Gammaproteobacteria bacterium RIFCSPHIGHO2_12_FULL_45_9]
MLAQITEGDFDTARASVLFNTDTEKTAYILILFALRDKITAFDHLAKNLLDLKQPTVATTDEIAIPITNFIQQRARQQGITQFPTELKKSILERKAISQQAIDSFSSQVKKDYLQYQNLLYRQVAINQYLIWALYKAASERYIKIRKETRNNPIDFLERTKLFNYQFQGIVKITDLGVMTDIQQAYARLSSLSFVEIATIIRGCLVRSAEKARYSQSNTQKSLLKNINELKITPGFQQLLSDGFIAEKTSFNWKPAALAIEQQYHDIKVKIQKSLQDTYILLDANLDMLASKLSAFALEMQSITSDIITARDFLDRSYLPLIHTVKQHAASTLRRLTEFKAIQEAFAVNEMPRQQQQVSRILSQVSLVILPIQQQVEQVSSQIIHDIQLEKTLGPTTASTLLDELQPKIIELESLQKAMNLYLEITELAINLFRATQGLITAGHITLNIARAAVEADPLINPDLLLKTIDKDTSNLIEHAIDTQTNVVRLLACQAPEEARQLLEHSLQYISAQQKKLDAEWDRVLAKAKSSAVELRKIIIELTQQGNSPGIAEMRQAMQNLPGWQVDPSECGQLKQELKKIANEVLQLQPTTWRMFQLSNDRVEFYNRVIAICSVTSALQTTSSSTSNLSP